MLITATSTIKPWETLTKEEQAGYRDEVSYVLHEAYEQCPSGDEDCVKHEIDAYFDAARYAHARTMLDAPFRFNTAAMTGLSTLARAVHPAGGLLGVLTGMPLAFVGIMEGSEGLRNRDRRLTVDAGFNLAIGAALTAGAFTGGPLLLAAPVLVGARELYLALDKG
ncbi:MAG: hypothetical protein AB1758_11650 [Candidatus Eremiobacterota bacterium]